MESRPRTNFQSQRLHVGTGLENLIDFDLINAIGSIRQWRRPIGSLWSPRNLRLFLCILY